jgi:two-component system LytT family response regulator
MTQAARPWRAVIVDDEPPAIKRLTALIADVAHLEVVAAFEDPAAARDALRRDPPDVVFLDIQMPGLSGFDVAAALPTPPLVVFVTAYDEYAVRAFAVNAVDYLLKPVTRERFAATITRVLARLGVNDAADLRARLDAVLAHLERPVPPTVPAAARIAVKANGRTVMLAADAIDRAEADGNTLRVFAGRDTLESRETLTRFEARLPPGMFVRASRAALVNVARVRHIEPWFHGDFVLVLLDGTKLTSGPTYRDRVRAAFGLP